VGDLQPAILDGFWKLGFVTPKTPQAKLVFVFLPVHPRCDEVRVLDVSWSTNPLLQFGFPFPGRFFFPQKVHALAIPS